jgi:hypothetical protein
MLSTPRSEATLMFENMYQVDNINQEEPKVGVKAASFPFSEKTGSLVKV